MYVIKAHPPEDRFIGKLTLKRYPQRQLEQLVTKIAGRIGVPPNDAAVLAESLIDADLQGTSTHGVSRLNIYLQRIEKGLINPNAQLGIRRATGSVLTLDGSNGLGQVQARKALNLLRPLGKKHGVAAATICNSQHFGTLSYFCNLMAAEGFILLAMTNCEPAMPPEGSFEAFFGTNPLAASFPTGKGFTIKIDLATSIVARGNIISAQRNSAPIPLGWALDSQGEPTTNAEQALLGTVLTMAGHKGYALALLVELFSGVLSTAAVGSDVGSMYKNLDQCQNVGHFFCLFDIEAFLDLSTFIQQVDEMIDRIKACKKRPGVKEIFVPGERSSRRAQINRDQGIPLSPETVLELEQWCGRLGVFFDLAAVPGEPCLTS
jgi:LDH2 family malate/lactate/ureidoglycolate dehydrogenase